MSNNKPIAGINPFKHLFRAPVGSLILPNTVQSGDWIGGSAGSTTGYVCVHYWDDAVSIIGDGTPYAYEANNQFDFSKRVTDSDTFEDRTFSVYSCDVNGLPSGDLIAVSLSDQTYGNIDFSPLVNIESLQLSNNSSIASLNLTAFNNLKRFVCDSNNSLQSIDISGLTSLINASLQNLTALSSLNTNGLSGLEYFYFWNISESITSINTTDFASIKDFQIGGCQGIASLDLTALSGLTNIRCQSCNSLTSLNVNGLSNLTNLFVNDSTGITSLDLAGLTSLTDLTFLNLHVSELDFTGLTSLTNINFWSLSYLDPTDIDNMLSSLDGNGSTNGYFNDGEISRTMASNTNYSSLIGKGWTLQLPSTPLQMPGARLTLTIAEPPTSQSTSTSAYPATSTGYAKVVYWDGTSQIVGNGSVFSKSNESINQRFARPIDQDSYSNKSIIIYSCNENGFPSGDILAFADIDSGNSLINADFSNLDKLQYLRLGNNSHITSLDLTACSDLYYFNVESLSSLTSVDLSGLTNLVSIRSENNSSLSAIDLTGSSILARSQSEIDLGRATENSLLFINNNTSLNSIDLTGFENLDNFSITNAPISILNSPLTYIRLFTISLTSLTSVNLSNCLNLERALIVDNGSLISINLTNSCSGEGTSRTNINDNPLLESISLAGCGFKNYGIYDNAKIDPNDIDSILAAWDSKGRTGGNFYGGNLPRTTLSNTNYTNLINKGWSLQLPATPILPAGEVLTIPTTLETGQSLGGNYIRTTTGYFKVVCWDGTYEINSVPNGGGRGYFNSKVVNDNYTDRTITVYSCTSTGIASGDITYLKLNGYRVKSTFNISNLKKLTYLDMGSFVNLTSFDLSGFNVLTSLIMETSSCPITSMNLSGLSSLLLVTLNGLTSMTSLNLAGSTNIQELNIYNYSLLTAIDVTSLTKLITFRIGSQVVRPVSITGISALTKLENLYIAYNSAVTSLNLNSLTKLKSLSLYTLSNLTSINISSLVDLESFTLDNTPVNQVFNFTGLTKLTNVQIPSINIYTPADIDNVLSLLDSNGKTGGYFTSGNTQRTTASGQICDNLIGKGWTLQIPAIAIQDARGYISIPMNLLPGQSLTDTSWHRVGTSTGYFKVLYWDGTSQIVSCNGVFNFDTNWNATGTFDKTVASNDTFTNRTIKIYSCTSLGTYSGYITSLNFGGNMNRMGDYDISGLKKLKYFDCGYNRLLTSVNVSDFNDLRGLRMNINGGVLSSLNVSGLSNLHTLEIISAPNLTSISSTWTNVEIAVIQDCSNLTSFDTSNFTRIKQLTIEKVSFAIDFSIISNGVGVYSNLENLTLQSSNTGILTSLNLGNLTKMRTLYLYQLSDITSLDLSHLTNLESLDLYNMISLDPTTINVTGLNKLGVVRVDNNGNWMSNQEIDNLLIELDGNGKTNGYFSSGNVQRTTLSIDAYTSLIGKGWTLVIPTSVIASPSGHLVIPTTLQPGDTFGINVYGQKTNTIGTSTGYFKVEYWDGTSEVVACHNYNYEGFAIASYDHYASESSSAMSPDLKKGYANFSITVGNNDNYTDRTINLYSCLSSGTYAGSITFLELDCRYVKPAIDFSVLKKLHRFQISNSSEIASVNLSGFNDLNNASIECFTAIYQINNGAVNFMGYKPNNLSSVNVAGLPKLKSFSISGADLLTSLSLAGLDLNSLSVNNNKLLTSLDLTGLTNLTGFNQQNNQIPGGLNVSLVGFSSLTKLENISLIYNLTTSLDLSSLVSLKSIYLSYCTNLTSLNLSSLVNLENLYLNANTALASAPSLVGLSKLTNFTIYGQVDFPYKKSDIDDVLIRLDTSAKMNGYFTSNIERTTLSTESYNRLIGKGWTLQMPSNVSQAPEGYVSIPTNLLPGESMDNSWSGQKINVGTSTGYFKTLFWDGTSQITSGLPFDGSSYVDNTGYAYASWQGPSYYTISKTVAANDTYTDRTINVYSCTSDGTPAGSILLLFLPCYKIKTTLDISGLKKVQHLGLFGATGFQSFDLSLLKDLKYLNIASYTYLNNTYGYGILNSLNLDKSNLLGLSIEGAALTSLDLTGATKLDKLELLRCKSMTSCDVSALTNLTRLSINDSPMQLNTTQLSKMNWLSVYNNNTITALDLTNMVNLNRIDVGYCSSITSLNLLNTTMLTQLYIWTLINITSLNVSSLVRLERIGIRGCTNLAPFSIAGLTKAWDVVFYTNALYTSSSINTLLAELDANGKSSGTFETNVKRTTLSQTSYTNLINKRWSIYMPSQVLA